MNNLTRKSMPTSGLASFLGSSFITNLSFWNNNAPIPITDTNFYSSDGLTNRQMCKLVKNGEIRSQTFKDKVSNEALLLQKLEKGLKLEPQNQDWLDSTLDNAKLKKLENLSPVAPLFP